MQPVRARPLIIIAALALALSPAAAQAEVQCSIHETGPLGPAGDVLKIRATEIEDQVAIVRSGQEIRITDDRTGAPQACVDGVPTVHNIDAIRFLAAADGAGLFVSLAGGPFAPSARPASAREIAISLHSVVEFPGNVGVGGTRGSDEFTVWSSSSVDRRRRINLDADADSNADISFPPGIVGVLVRGGAGADRVNAAHVRVRQLSLSMYAGPGADRLVGGPAGDIIFGRAGRDSLRGGPGRDELDCGPGRDRAVNEGADSLTGCVVVRRAKRALFSL